MQEGKGWQFFFVKTVKNIAEHIQLPEPDKIEAKNTLRHSRPKDVINGKPRQIVIQSCESLVPDSFAVAFPKPDTVQQTKLAKRLSWKSVKCMNKSKNNAAKLMNSSVRYLSI